MVHDTIVEDVQSMTGYCLIKSSVTSVKCIIVTFSLLVFSRKCLR